MGRWSRRLIVAAAGFFAVFVSIANAQVEGSPQLFQPGAPGQSGRVLTAEQSVELGQSRFTAADVKFMQDMIVHHGQAVEMVALIDGRSTSPSIRAMGERISISQSFEIEMMRTWLRRRGQPLESEAGHQHHGHRMGDGDMALMKGMLSPQQMKQLAKSSGDEFNRLFLSGMILHHQGALDMVDALLIEPLAGEDPEISEFLSSIIAEQSAEILRMQVMLSEL